MGLKKNKNLLYILLIILAAIAVYFGVDVNEYFPDISQTGSGTSI